MENATSSAPFDGDAFEPKPAFRVPWDSVVTGFCALLAIVVASLGLLVLAHAAPGILGTLPRSRGVDLLAAAFLVAFAAPGLLQWRRRRRLRKLDERLPDFLTDLGALHKAGLTLPDSLRTAAEGDYGPLGQEVRVAADQVRWNIPVLTALENLKHRLGTPISQRSLTVVVEAGRTGGNLPEVIEIAAANARSFVQLRDGRARSMGLYTIIIYVASLVFVGVALALQGVFVPKMLLAFSQTTGSGLGLASTMPTSDQFRSLFYSVALVQAIGNGLVGGMMTEGRATAGLRHAWFLVLLCAIGFALT